MKRTISIFIFAFAILGVAKAITVQKIILKNGSVLNGYIQQQTSNGLMTIRTDNAIVYVNNSNAVIYDRKIVVGELEQAWKDWAEKNDAFEGVGNNRTLTLSDVSFKHDVTKVADSTVTRSPNKGFDNFLGSGLQQVSKVKVLERGVRVKYLELSPNTYIVSWKDIESIKGERRAKTALSGINRVYELKDGRSCEGQYAEETDNTLSLYMDNGIVESFKINDVVKYTFRPINPNQDIFEQSELIDIVKTRNGGQTRGIIVEQNYSSKKDTENYFLIQTEGGGIQSIKVSEILELCKEENPKYAPKSDILLNNGDVVINRMATCTLIAKEKGDLLQLDILCQKVNIQKGANNTTKVTVEYRLDGSTNVETFKLIKIADAEAKKGRPYTFGYKAIFNSQILPMSVETSVNKTTKAEYTIVGTGIFALFDTKKKEAIPFIIQ